MRKPSFFKEESWIMLSLVIIPLVAILAAYFGPAIFGKYYSKKVRDTYKELKMISEAINHYHDSNGIYPSSLDELGLSSIRDRYSKSGENYIYKITNNKILLYSRGPDWDDDMAIVEYNSKNGMRSNGDIIFRE